MSNTKPEITDTTGRVVELRAFLLGTLEEPDVERIEYSLLSDGELYELLLATEEELIDEYLSGALSEGEASCLLGYLDRLPGGRARIDFGRELRRRFAASAPSAPRGRSQWVDAWRGFFPLRPAFAALFLLAVASILHLATHREPEPLVLTAGLTRSEGQIPTASLSGAPNAIPLELDLAFSSHQLYRATLYDAESRAIATFGELTATSTERRILVALTLPVAGLEPGDYSIGLEGEATGEFEPLGRYVFRLTE